MEKNMVELKMEEMYEVEGGRRVTVMDEANNPDWAGMGGGNGEKIEMLVP